MYSQYSTGLQNCLLPFSLSSKEEVQKICEEFVCAVKQYTPEFVNKVKIHLLLHLTDSICDFGPTSAFNTER